MCVGYAVQGRAELKYSGLGPALEGARSYRSFERGPSSGLRPGRLGLKPGPLVCSMEVSNTTLLDTLESICIVKRIP